MSMMRCLLATMAVCAALPVTALAQSRLIVVTGVAGEPQYGAQFHDWAVTLVDAAKKAGTPAGSVIYLGEKVERDPARISARSTRENVDKAIRDVAASARPDESVVIVLIGHGSAEGGPSKFNLPGPDLTAGDFAVLLDALGRTRPIVFVNLASASGGFVEPLSAPNRVIVTATKSGAERNESVFGKYFVQAVAGTGADTDKDNRVSVLEAFGFARREVARFYQEQNRLQTEHAVLDDNGDRVASAEPDGKTDGTLARATILAGGAAPAVVARSPELQLLYDRKRTLEAAIEALKQKKSTMAQADYDRQLEKLLLDLASNGRDIRAKEATK